MAGNLTMIYDYVNRQRINTSTDSEGNVTTTVRDIDSGAVLQEYRTQDNTYTETVGGATYAVTYAYDDDGRMTSASWTTGGTTVTGEIHYDDLDRQTAGVLSAKTGEQTVQILNTSYVYNDAYGFGSSNQVSAVQYRGAGYENLIVYGYDKNGNITKAGDVTYVYDEAGQLTRVNDPQNGTTVYVYNQKGNIAAVQSYDYTVGELGTCKNTVSYTYGNSNWSDQLTSYNGQAITYDGAGNPTYYKSAQLSWKNGRYLSSYAADGYSVEYAYNAQGLRTYKEYEYQQDSGETHTTPFTYTYDANGRLTGQWYYDVPYFYFYYDKAGNPIALEYGGTVYYYVKNLQGDIIALLDRWGNCVVEYTYDAWGKVLSVTGSMAESLGNDNPLRYRGYYYDQETGLYYLQSRYYDPETGRFISADGVNMLLSGEQAYTYCGNNPVNRSDPTGKTPGMLDFSDWTDTVLHMGLSPDQATYSQLIYAIKNGIGGEAYYSNAIQLLWDISAQICVDAMNDLFHIALPLVARQAQALINYQYNKKSESFWKYYMNEQNADEYLIYGQGDPYIHNFRYGMVKDASNVICEVAAMYNALVLMGRNVSFAKLIYNFEISGHMLLNGYLGTSPFVYDKIAKKYGLTYDYSQCLSNVDMWLPSSGVVIISFWNCKGDITQGMHTIAVQIETNGILAFNVYGNSQKPKPYDSFSNMLEDLGGQFICAYYLYDLE